MSAQTNQNVSHQHRHKSETGFDNISRHSSNAIHRRGKHDFASQTTNAQTLHVILSEKLELGRVGE